MSPTGGALGSTGGADGGGVDGSSDAGAEGDGSGSAKLDVGPSGAEGPGDQTGGCKKVDLLFVIDNSISMAGEQANLIASFDGFISGIRQELVDTQSVHVGVITTDAYDGNEEQCRLLGALVTQTGGGASSEAVCGPFSEGRFMTQDDDLESAFACAAQVGIDGDNNERVMDAVKAALAGSGNGCNAGFLRSDALLVLVLITDEDDKRQQLYDTLEGSLGDPPDWYDMVVQAKGGLDTNVSVLTITGGMPGNVCPPADAVEGAEDAVRLRDFTSRFTHGFLGDVCAPSYDPFFTQAVEVVESACNDFIPPK